MSRMDKSGKQGGTRGLIAAGRQLEQIKAQARALGIFTDDREFLECPSCGLLEDVTSEGLLVTYPKDCVDLEDCGLRFEQVRETSFACPTCGGQDQGGDFVSALPPSARRGRPCASRFGKRPGAPKISSASLAKAQGHCCHFFYNVRSWSHSAGELLPCDLPIAAI